MLQRTASVIPRVVVVIFIGIHVLMEGVFIVSILFFSPEGGVASLQLYLCASMCAVDVFYSYMCVHFLYNLSIPVSGCSGIAQPCKLFIVGMSFICQFVRREVVSQIVYVSPLLEKRLFPLDLILIGVSIKGMAR